MTWIEWCKEFFFKHPATSIGLLLGVLLGISFAAFGFWRTFIVAVCVIAGLYIGIKVDAGEGPDWNVIKERWYSWRKNIK